MRQGLLVGSIALLFPAVLSPAFWPATAEVTLPGEVSAAGLALLLEQEVQLMNDGNSIVSSFLGTQDLPRYFLDGDEVDVSYLQGLGASDLVWLAVDTVGRPEVRMERRLPEHVERKDGEVRLHVTPSRLAHSQISYDRLALYMVGPVLVSGWEVWGLSHARRSELERRAEQIDINSAEAVSRRLGLPVRFQFITIRLDTDPRPFLFGNN